MPTMSVSKRLRMEILRRDNYTCRYCGGTAPDVKLTIDHVNPVTLGGTDDPDNLVTACVDCNAGKSSIAPDSPVVDDVAQDAMRWAAAIKEAARIQAAQQASRETLIEWADSEWFINMGQFRRRPAEWPETILRFVEAGLTQDDLAEAFQITARKRDLYGDQWRYFCGVCWRKLDKLNEIARALLAVEENDGP